MSTKTEQYLESIAKSLRSIDQRLKKITGEDEEESEKPKIKAKSYAERYFAKTEDGKWQDK